jgi:hypothetical protein
MRKTYRVSFFKKLVDSSGHPVDACQGVIEVGAISAKRAIVQARLTFAERSHIGHWSLHADYETVEAIPAHERTPIKLSAPHIRG